MQAFALWSAVAVAGFPLWSSSPAPLEPHSSPTPTTSCPSRCSGHGWCVPRWQAWAVADSNGSAIVEQSGGTVAAAELDDATRQVKVCACVRGWRGAACDVDTCPGHCEEHGVCLRGECACHAGWQGPSCGLPTVIPPPPAPPSPPPPPICAAAHDCSGHGTCDGGVCSCHDGFKGERCEMVTEVCPGGCSGHGRCDRERGMCVCSLGYAGEDCGRSACADATDDSPHGCHGRGRCECSRER